MSIEIKQGEQYDRKSVGIVDYRDALRTKEAHTLIGPNNVLLQVNYGCYLHCEMCDRHMWSSNGAPVDQVFTTEELFGMFDQLRDLGTRRVTLVGTEPVLRHDLPEILTYLREQGIKPELYTAGVLLTDEVIESVLNNSVDTSFSVDGFYKSSHNSIRVPGRKFDAHGKTLDSIHRLREAREKRGMTQSEARITANFTIQRKNIHDLETATAEEIDQVGVDVIRMSLVHGEGEYILNSQDIPVLVGFAERVKQMDDLDTKVSLSAGIKYLVRRMIHPEHFDQNVLVPSATLDGSMSIGCHIAEYSTMIDPQGGVRPCLYLYDDNGPVATSDRDKFLMGNARQQRFADIWNGERYMAFREEYRFPNLAPGSRCRTCEYTNQFEAIDKALANQQDGAIQIGW